MQTQIKISAYNCARNLTYRGHRRTQWWWKMHFLRHDGDTMKALQADGIQANDNVKIGRENLIIMEG